MARISRFKKRESDRSGFDALEIGLAKELGKPWKVSPDEVDAPPPSKRPLGGEGDIAGSPRDSSDFADGVSTAAVPAGFDNPTVVITAAGGISPSFVHPWMRVSGVTDPLNITANPQVAADREGRVLTLQCVSNGLVLDEGTGLQLIGSVGYTLNSGNVTTMMYNTGNSVWIETSRADQYGSPLDGSH